MESIIDRISAILKQKEDVMPEFLFTQEQSVRVKKSLYMNIDGIKHLLGQIGTINKCYRKYKYGCIENWYQVKFPNGDIEDFEECELDLRFGIKKKR